jgi:hypothetical protein
MRSELRWSVEPPWGVEPQTYALRETPTHGTTASTRPFVVPDFAPSRSTRTVGLRFAPRTAPRRRSRRSPARTLCSIAARTGTSVGAWEAAHLDRYGVGPAEFGAELVLLLAGLFLAYGAAFDPRQGDVPGLTSSQCTAPR